MGDKQPELKRTINLLDASGTSRLESVKGSNTSFFTGTDDLINLNFDPYVSGYAFIYWVHLPEWFEADPDLKYFKDMTQKNFMSFSGVSNIELETTQSQTGFAGVVTYDSVGGIQRANNDFTITHKEYSGGIMRKLYSKWIYLMRDPRTGIALYPKLFGVEYGARNHTGQLLYVVVRPDATNVDSKDGIVEYAAFYTNVFPRNVPLDIYNFQAGEQSTAQVDINFSGVAEVGPAVEEYAATVLKEKILNTDNGGLPFIDAMGVGNGAINKDSMTGALKDIYGI